MNRNFVVLFVAANVLMIALGGVFTYSDLYVRRDTSRYHENTEVIGVEYSLLCYRPIYEYDEIVSGETVYVVSEGSWTLDFLQSSIIVAAIACLLYVLSARQTSELKEQPVS